MSAGGHIDPSNKKVALLIAVLAAFLMWGAMGLGALGVVFTLIGFFAPAAVHLY